MISPSNHDVLNAYSLVEHQRFYTAASLASQSLSMSNPYPICLADPILYPNPPGIRSLVFVRRASNSRPVTGTVDQGLRWTGDIEQAIFQDPPQGSIWSRRDVSQDLAWTKNSSHTWFNVTIHHGVTKHENKELNLILTLRPFLGISTPLPLRFAVQAAGRAGQARLLNDRSTSVTKPSHDRPMAGPRC